jgi:hypothetical protein
VGVGLVFPCMCARAQSRELSAPWQLNSSYEGIFHPWTCVEEECRPVWTPLTKHRVFFSGYTTLVVVQSSRRDDSRSPFFLKIFFPGKYCMIVWICVWLFTGGGKQTRTCREKVELLVIEAS